MPRTCSKKRAKSKCTLPSSTWHPHLLLILLISAKQKTLSRQFHSVLIWLSSETLQKASNTKFQIAPAFTPCPQTLIFLPRYHFSDVSLFTMFHGSEYVCSVCRVLYYTSLYHGAVRLTSFISQALSGTADITFTLHLLHLCRRFSQLLDHSSQRHTNKSLPEMPKSSL